VAAAIAEGLIITGEICQMGTWFWPWWSGIVLTAICRLVHRSRHTISGVSPPGASPWIEERPICWQRKSSWKLFRLTAMKCLLWTQRCVRVVERYGRHRVWMTMAAGSATNAWRH